MPRRAPGSGSPCPASAGLNQRSASGGNEKPLRSDCAREGSGTGPAGFSPREPAPRGARACPVTVEHRIRSALGEVISSLRALQTIVPGKHLRGGGSITRVEATCQPESEQYSRSVATRSHLQRLPDPNRLAEAIDLKLHADASLLRSSCSIATIAASPAARRSSSRERRTRVVVKPVVGSKVG
jgi:hypothetical protein